MANFSFNLQQYRMGSGMTQEQLAEKMGVSRQTVSKWESGASYPEMEKLIALCGLFDCTLDALVRGELPQSVPEEPMEQAVQTVDIRTAYERAMTRTSWGIAAGVMILIASVSVNLFISASGAREAWAIVAMFLTVAAGLGIVIVNGYRRGQFRRRHPQLPELYSEAEREGGSRWFPFGIGGGVALILVGICVVVLGEEIPAPPGFNADFFTGVFLIFVSLGVGVLVFNGLKKDQYNIAKYNRENEEDPDIPAPDAGSARIKRKNQIVGGICGVVMMTATIVFLIVGFTSQLWAAAGIIYPVGGILCGIISVIANIFDHKKGE